MTAGFTVAEWQATYDAHRPDNGGYCLGFHWDRGVAWPCDVRVLAEVALDLARRSRSAEEANPNG